MLCYLDGGRPARRRATAFRCCLATAWLVALIVSCCSTDEGLVRELRAELDGDGCGVSQLTSHPRLDAAGTEDCSAVEATVEATLASWVGRGWPERRGLGCVTAVLCERVGGQHEQRLCLDSIYIKSHSAITRTGLKAAHSFDTFGT